MKFFLDTANLAEIEEAASWGVLAGVTTNPTLYAREEGCCLADFPKHVKAICDIVDGPVSAEAVGTRRADIVREGLGLAEVDPRVVVKVPVMPEGLAATTELASRGVAVNMTLVFSVPQAILAARSGARYVSPFVGRFDDIAEDGIAQLADVVTAIANYDFGHPVEVIAASLRHPQHVTAAALMGADIATIPFGVLAKIVKHPLTDRGLESFLSDWEKVKNS